MDDLRIFRPTPASTVNLSVTSSSSRVQVLTATSLADVSGSSVVRLYNAGSVVVFVAFGDSTVTATTTANMPIAPGSVEAFRVNPAQTHVAGITAAGTATLYATPGAGA